MVSPSQRASPSQVNAHVYALIGFALIDQRSAGSVPGFADVEVRMDASATRESKWGKSETFTKTWVTKYPAKAQPGRTVRVIVTIERGSLEVPYKIRQKSKSTGQIGETTGIWKGVSSGNTTVEYRDE